MSSKHVASDGSLIWHDEPESSKPSPGGGASRQTRRIQLRNAGFRGPTMPGRKVTPKSLSSSTWSNASGGHPQSSDAENQSPSGARANLSVGKRKGSGVLTEIGNSTLTRPKRQTPARPRVTSAKFFTNMEGRKSGEYDVAFPEENPSPPAHKSSIKPRSAKVRSKLGAKRRSVSGETKHYIDHLEAELAAAQSQLSAVTSPSVTRQQTSKLRTLNSETKQLQQALEEWESKYEERVQEIVEQYTAVEVSLRSQIRGFEEQSEEDRYRIHELEEQVGNMNQGLESAEAANVQLEKRLEILSDLLATSAKIDLHAETPGRNRRMSRPKSMHPRFPTTGNLMISPERLSEAGTQPTSPALSFTDPSGHLDLRQTRSHQELISGSFSQSDHVSDAESVFSDAPMLGESLTTAEAYMPIHHTSIDMPPPSIPGRGRPTRRMRRFGAGSMGPKPLILPSASHFDHVPASAPVLERHETMPSLPFRDSSLGRRDGSPMFGRRRASTMVDQATMASLTGSALLTVPSFERTDDNSSSIASPTSTKSQSSVKDYSSLGSCTGAAVSRNLMEELSQIRSIDTSEESIEHSEQTNDAESVPDSQDGLDTTELQASFHEPLDPIPESHSREVSETTTTTTTATVIGLRPRTTSMTTSPPEPQSFIARLRALFGDLWRSPVDLARHLIRCAQSRMRLPEALCNVQWWLVGVLLGPMAKRRLLSTQDPPPHCESETPSRRRLLARSRSADDLAYGSFYPSSPEAGASKRSLPKPGMAGPGKKRAKGRDSSGSVEVRSKQRELVGFRKHSPWLWLKFSITLAFAIGCAFRSGPGSLLVLGAERRCSCGACVAGRRRGVEGVGS
ncbi:hypothetical protein WHR41_01731 [Cladosporium halotolerans]|uniref:Uncharacterized protein n=1 Tax=Cladosporium halotolerans TaxID=1052096 RepID=A0AB34KWN6_9PEZI